MTLPDGERLALEINAEHELARTCLHDSLSHAVRVGELLIEARAMVPRGEWLGWIDDNCAFSTRHRAELRSTCPKERRVDRGRERNEPQHPRSASGAFQSIRGPNDPFLLGFARVVHAGRGSPAR